MISLYLTEQFKFCWVFTQSKTKPIERWGREATDLICSCF
jgi:hypothetical protein